MRNDSVVHTKRKEKGTVQMERSDQAQRDSLSTFDDHDPARLESLGPRRHFLSVLARQWTHHVFSFHLEHSCVLAEMARRDRNKRYGIVRTLATSTHRCFSLQVYGSTVAFPEEGSLRYKTLCFSLCEILFCCAMLQAPLLPFRANCLSCATAWLSCVASCCACALL